VARSTPATPDRQDSGQTPDEAERQRFVDEAAMRNHAAIIGGPDDSTYHNNSAANAYAEAEALWTERQKRRGKEGG
jgi:hypothetical protein